MTLPSTDSKDPRWGDSNREIKGRSILGTLVRLADERCRDGIWLDIGCGSGEISAELSRDVERVIGIDPEPWARWNDLRCQCNNLEFVEAGYRELSEKLGAASVDVVVCNQVYEHVDDPQALLKQIAEVLKPGGLCYFAGPNLIWPIEPHVHWPIVHWLPRRFALALMSRLGSKRVSDLDAWSLSYWQLRRLFQRAGLQSSCALAERIRAGAEISRSRGLSRLAAVLPRFVSRWLHPLSPGFVFLLQKPRMSA